MKNTLAKVIKYTLKVRIKTRNGTRKRGLDRYTEVHVNEFTFLSTKKQTDALGKQITPEAPKAEETPPDDNLPF